MRASWYARALLELAREHGEDNDKIVTQFVATVRTNGHAHMLPRIVKSLERIITKDERERTITITSAVPIPEAEILGLLKKEPYKHALSPDHKKVVRKTDETLIGGMIVRTAGTRIDASYKKNLIDLYQDLTTT